MIKTSQKSDKQDVKYSVIVIKNHITRIMAHGNKSYSRNIKSYKNKYLEVYPLPCSFISSGVPQATTSPPRLPPSGPISMI